MLELQIRVKKYIPTQKKGVVNLLPLLCINFLQHF